MKKKETINERIGRFGLVYCDEHDLFVCPCVIECNRDAIADGRLDSFFRD
jgi:hypothetical protein